MLKNDLIQKRFFCCCNITVITTNCLTCKLTVAIFVCKIYHYCFFIVSQNTCFIEKILYFSFEYNSNFWWWHQAVYKFSCPEKLCKLNLRPFIHYCFGKNSLTPRQPMICTQGSLLQSCNVFVRDPCITIAYCIRCYCHHCIYLTQQPPTFQ